MNVRPGGPAGIAHFADLLSPFDPLTHAQVGKPLKVAVDRSPSVPVSERDIVSEQTIPLDFLNSAIRSGIDGGAPMARDVDPVVELPASRVRVVPVSVA